jgi:2-phospho-L-lactate/phosphoenolpyruvate guanylyltransferase
MIASWTVVIPVKAPAGGKTRLAPALDDDARMQLARAFALDTIAAVQAATSVERVIVVSDDPSLADRAEFLAEPGGVERGLLPAIRHALRSLSPSNSLSLSKGAHTSGGSLRRAQGTEVAVAVLLGDLPGLRPEELDAALEAAARHPLAFVRDADGTGTTLATAAPGVHFEPQFGSDSAARHAAAGFVELAASAWPGLIRDVDTVDGLTAVLHHGVGDHTAEVVARLADRKGTP